MNKPIDILLVDDDERSRDSIQVWLEENHQWKVDAVGSGEEALERVRSRLVTAFDVILLDRVLEPDKIDGLETLRQIRELHVASKVIMFTKKDQTSAIQALQAGAYRYITRPFEVKELTSLILSITERRSSLQEIATIVTQLLQVPVCIIWELSRPERQFKISAWVGDVRESLRTKAHIDWNSDVVQRVLLNRGPIYIPDIHDEKIASEYGSMHQLIESDATYRSWASLLAAPIYVDNAIVGMIEAYTLEPRIFEAAQQDLLRTLADQAAIAVRNTRLYDRGQALLEVTQKLSESFDADKILDLILQWSLDLVGADFGWLYLADQTTRNLRIWSSIGIRPEEAGIIREIDDGITGWVAKYGSPQVVPDVLLDDRYVSIPGYAIRSQIVVPLKRRSKVLGVLAVKSKHPNYFPNDDLDLLLSLAAQATLVLERADLTRHLQEVSRLASIGNFDELSGYATDAVHELTGSQVVLWELKRDALQEAGYLAVASSSGGSAPDYNIPLDSSKFITALALEKKMPVIRQDILDPDEAPDEPTFYYLDEARHSNWRSYMAVPLLSQVGLPLGSLSLYDTDVAKFGEPDAELVGTFANQLAVALETRNRIQSLERMVMIAEAVTYKTAAGMKPVLEEVAKTACELFGAQFAVIYPYDAEHKLFYDIENVVSHGVKDLDLRTKPRKRGLATEIRRLGELVVYDTQAGELGVKDSHLFADRGVNPKSVLKLIKQAHFIQREEVKAFVGLSLRTGQPGSETNVGEQEVGVLYIDFRRPHHFSEEQLQLVRIFGLLAANAIQTARLFQKEHALHAQADALREISKTISTELEQEALARAILKGLKQVVGYRKATIQLINGDTRELIAYDGISKTGVSEWLLRPISEDRLIARVIKKRGPLILADPVRDPDWEVRPETLDVRSWACVPLIYNKEPIGLLTLDHDQPRFYNRPLGKLLAVVGSQAAIAIHKAGLYAKLKERLKDLDALNEISQGLSTTYALDVHDMALLLYARAHDLMDMRHFFVASYNSKQDLVTFDLAIENGREIETGNGEWKSRTGGQGLTETVIKKGYSLYIPSDVLGERQRMGAWEGLRLGKTWEDQLAHPEDGIVEKCWLGVPIKIGDETLGVIGVQNYDVSDAYDHYDEQVLTTVASQLGIGIIRHRLERRNHQLEALSTIGRTVSSLDVDRILQLVYDQMNLIMNLDDAQVQFAFYNDDIDQTTFPLAIEKDNGRLVDVVRWAKRESGEEVEQFKPRAKSLRYGLTEYVIDTRRPRLLIEQFREPGASIEQADSDSFVLALGLHTDMDHGAQSREVTVWRKFGRFGRRTNSWLGVPMIVQDRVIGIISVQSLGEEPPVDHDQLMVLETISNQAAVSIENARLYTRDKKNIEQLKHIHRIALDVSSKLDIQEILVSIAEGSNIVLGADFTTIFPYDPDRGFDKGVRVGSNKKTPSIPSRNRWMERIVQKREPLEIVDVQGARFLKREFLDETGTKSFAAYPICFADVPVGVLLANFATQHAFTPEEREWMGYLANQAAVAIQNVRNFVKATEMERLQMAALMSADFLHRLGNFLGSIPPRLQLIEEGYLNSEATLDAEAISSQLHMLTDDITDTRKDLQERLERPPAERLQNIDVNLLLRSVIIRLGTQALSGVRFETDYEPDLPTVLCYPTSLFEAVSTVIQNAVDATEGTGRTRLVTVRSQQVEDQDSAVQIKITVEDNGHGISAQELPRVFELFYTTKPEGIGYGLFRARHVTRQLGGDILITSILGQGTEVNIFIPKRS